MAGRRRPPPAPAPPQVGALLIDGANVIATAAPRAVARLWAAIDWCRSFGPELPIALFLDQTTFARCSEGVRADLQAIGGGGAAVALTVTPAGEAADAVLLREARLRTALVLTNDRYRDHASLRAGVLTLQFTFARGRFRPSDHATWFTPAGGAARCDLAQLAAACGRRPAC